MSFIPWCKRGEFWRYRQHCNRNLCRKLHLEVDKCIIDRSHRIRSKKKDQKPRPIIVKFCSWRDRSKVFYNKKMLKNSGVTITESLTKTRMDLLNEVQRIVGEGNSWTIDDNIFVKKGKKIVRISKRSEAESLMTIESNNEREYFD